MVQENIQKRNRSNTVTSSPNIVGNNASVASPLLLAMKRNNRINRNNFNTTTEDSVIENGVSEMRLD